MNALTEAVGGLLAGGATGLLGTVAGRLIGLFERRQDRLAAEQSNAFKRERWAHELQLAEQSGREQAAARAADLEKTREQAAGRALARSVAAETALKASYPWVDAVRALVRPTLTLLLWAVATGIYISLLTESEFLADAERADLARYLTASVVYCATAATLWWFGDRAPRPPGLTR